MYPIPLWDGLRLGWALNFSHLSSYNNQTEYLQICVHLQLALEYLQREAGPTEHDRLVKSRMICLTLGILILLINA